MMVTTTLAMIGCRDAMRRISVESHRHHAPVETDPIRRESLG
jgi:hypothetical protein